jgi:hypothetical protein
VIPRAETPRRIRGEIDDRAKGDLLGKAAMLFPIEWSEPFGLVMIEAMACGTPVIARRRGSVPEVLEHGVTGCIVDDLDEAVRAVEGVGRLSRAGCRHAFERRFDARRTAMDHVDVYRRVALPAGAAEPPRSPSEAQRIRSTVGSQASGEATTDQKASTSPKGQAPWEEPVGRPESARPGERQDAPRAALLQRVCHQHRRDGKEPERRQHVHPLSLTAAAKPQRRHD